MKLQNKPIRILSLPSYHWYMKKFNDGKHIVFVNPNSDVFQQTNIDSSKKQLSPIEHIKNEYPPETFDLVHIHFEYQFLELNELIILLKYFKKIQKPIVWTVHDRYSNELPYDSKLKYEKILFKYADKIITLTDGCKNWIDSNLGVHKNGVDVIKHGFIELPDKISGLIKTISKKHDLFTILLGSFRPNKTSILPIINFLMATELNSKKIRILCNPFPMSFKDNVLLEEFRNFYSLVANNPRVELICHPFIEHDDITNSFLESHAVILPYLWGTHSGQLELARDCGCHVIAPAIGFYKEQWDNINTFDISDGKISAYANRYVETLIRVSKLSSITPDVAYRINEFNEILIQHFDLYSSLIHKK